MQMEVRYGKTGVLRSGLHAPEPHRYAVFVADVKATPQAFGSFAYGTWQLPSILYGISKNERFSPVHAK